MAGGYVLLGLMLLTVLAVFSRKVLNSPIMGIQDISEVCLVLLVFSAMAYAGWTGGHIAVDLIESIVSKPVLKIFDITMRSAGAIFMAILSWQSALRAVEAGREAEATNLVAIPLYPFFWVITAGFGLFALVLALLAIRAAKGDPEFFEQ